MRITRLNTSLPRPRGDNARALMSPIFRQRTKASKRPIHPVDMDYKMNDYPVTPDDLDMLARVLWGECRGELREGQEAVAWVIRNRCERALDYIGRTGKDHHPLFGDGTVKSCVNVPWQFSCLNRNDPNCSALLTLDQSNSVYKSLYLVGEGVFDGSISNPIGGSTHYCVSTLVGTPKQPQWVIGAVLVAKIGNHSFYAGVK
jgi:N-acetylmuramoyl-L-alanine amidase